MGKTIIFAMICMLLIGCAYPTLAQRQMYVNNHSNLLQQTREDILNGTIRIGMTKEQFLAVYKKPAFPYDSINRTVTRYGVREQWCYDSPREYFYFENGILTSWQD